MAKIRINQDFKRNRSDRYQHVIVESSCAPDVLAEFSDAQGVTGFLNEDNYEKLHLLKEKLKQAFWRIIKNKLTPRQCEVIEYLADGYTQIEVARILQINQSSITKSLNGNVDYRNVCSGGAKRIYGGAKKKLRKIAEEDPEIQMILKQIEELYE